MIDLSTYIPHITLNLGFRDLAGELIDNGSVASKLPIPQGTNQRAILALFLVVL
jgi:hypothetical protein